MVEVEIIKPDDWHIHFRDNKIMRAVVPETTRHFRRGIVMPNLNPPILNGKQAIEYKNRIENAIPKNDNFLPLMTIYLTENTLKSEIATSFHEGLIFAAKLYPAGATTNSDSGVKDIHKIMDVLETMAKIGMPLLIHGEVTDKKVDIFDREKEFVEKILDFICKKLPDLKITLEHITTKDAVKFIYEGNENLAATITPHHLALNRNDFLAGGIKPHYYCLPIIKREIHRKALIEAASSGSRKFFLGTDTAPHLKCDKQSACGCAGVFNATYCMPILAQIFDDKKSLSKLENFVSINGAKHYGLKISKEKLRLTKTKEPIKFKNKIMVDEDDIVIFKPTFDVFWKVI